MEQTYALSSWVFARALSLIYVIAFLSILVQAKGLWGDRGILPMKPYLKAVEQTLGSSGYFQLPSLFWLSSSNEMIWGAALTGAILAGSAFFGFAQGWCLLGCWFLYLSFCSGGQDFMSFQWDALLCEAGFLALFAVPWNFDFTLTVAQEPHWIVRGVFCLLLFKLMFLSGVVKLMSGDESWRDFTAMTYHYWTQPLPNPLSPFMSALPMWYHKFETALTFAIELVLPFFMLWPRARVAVAAGFAALSLMILLTGNYTFFNWLTLALCVWLVPDGFWEKILPFTLRTQAAPLFPNPGIMAVMAALTMLSLIWCTRFWLPDAALEWMQPVLRYSQIFHVSNPYGLFANMTKSRPEIVIEGSMDGTTWSEYDFKYKPGNLYRRPPVVAPYQPRLDWQMWFAALGSFRNTPWFGNFMLRLLENSPDVTALLGNNPFAEHPPKFLRARLYNYEFASTNEILNSDQWWTRQPIGDYTPVLTLP